MNVLGVSLGGWIPNTQKVQDEEGSELLRTAQNLSLLSPLTWRRTTLELAGQSKDKEMIIRPMSMANFSTILDTDTDGFNQCFDLDPLLRQKCDMYIGKWMFSSLLFRANSMHLLSGGFPRFSSYMFVVSTPSC